LANLRYYIFKTHTESYFLLCLSFAQAPCSDFFGRSNFCLCPKFSKNRCINRHQIFYTDLCWALFAREARWDASDTKWRK